MHGPELRSSYERHRKHIGLRSKSPLDYKVCYSLHYIHLSLWRIVIHVFVYGLGAFIWTPLVVLLNHYVFESDLIAGGMSSIVICTCLDRAVLIISILLFQFVHILREMDWISRCTLCWIGVFGCCFWIPRYVGIVMRISVCRQISKLILSITSRYHAQYPRIPIG